MAKKITAPFKRYTVKLEGELAGAVLEMRGMTARDMISLRGGEMSDADAIEMVVGHVIEHNIDVEDLRDLDAHLVIDILGRWSAAISEAALPNAPAAS